MNIHVDRAPVKKLWLIQVLNHFQRSIKATTMSLISSVFRHSLEELLIVSMDTIFLKAFVISFHILAILDTIVSSNDCQDSPQYLFKCSEWALRGECTKSSDFMMKFCKKSCNECPPPMPEVVLIPLKIGTKLSMTKSESIMEN